MERVISRYTPDIHLSDWRNSLILPGPGGNLQAVVPNLSQVVLGRSYSSKTIMTITMSLRQEGMKVDGNTVAHILRTGNHTHPAARQIVAQAAKLSVPMPTDNWDEGADDYLGDSLVIELCDALLDWSHNPTLFSQWETIFNALLDPDLFSILAWAMSENRPRAGTTKSLLESVANNAAAMGNPEAGLEAQLLLETMADTDDRGATLFTISRSHVADLWAEMGCFLQAATGVELP